MPLHYIAAIALGTFVLLSAVWIGGLAVAAIREMLRGDDNND